MSERIKSMQKIKHSSIIYYTPAALISGDTSTKQSRITFNKMSLLVILLAIVAPCHPRANNIIFDGPYLISLYIQLCPNSDGRLGGSERHLIYRLLHLR